MPGFTQSHTFALLQITADRRVAALAADTGLVVALTAVVNATLEIAENPPPTGMGLATAVARKSLAVSGVAAASGSRNLEVASFAVGRALKSIDLKAAGMTPVRA